MCVDSLFVMKYKKKDRILLSPPCNHKAYNFKVVQFVPSLNFPTFLGRNRNTHQNVTGSCTGPAEIPAERMNS